MPKNFENVDSKIDNKRMLKYYCVWLHKAWIYFWMVITTAGIIIAGAILFYWLADRLSIFTEIIIIKPTYTEGELIGESNASILPGFITGTIGVVLGFWLESIFIARLRIIKKFCGLRSCLLDQMRFVLHKIILGESENTVNLYAIENIISSPDSLSVLYSLPRYIKWPKYYGEYGEKFFDAARALNDYNTTVTKEGKGAQSDKNKAIKKCLEFMLAVDDKLIKQMLGGLKEQNNSMSRKELKEKVKNNLPADLKSLKRKRLRRIISEYLINKIKNNSYDEYVKAYCILTDE